MATTRSRAPSGARARCGAKTSSKSCSRSIRDGGKRGDTLLGRAAAPPPRCGRLMDVASPHHRHLPHTPPRVLACGTAGTPWRRRCGTCGSCTRARSRTPAAAASCVSGGHALSLWPRRTHRSHIFRLPSPSAARLRRFASFPWLKRYAMLVVARTLAPSQMAYARDMYEAFDRHESQDGRVSGITGAWPLSVRVVGRCGRPLRAGGESRPPAPPALTRIIAACVLRSGRLCPHPEGSPRAGDGARAQGRACW